MRAAIEITKVWRPPVADVCARRRTLWWSVGPTGELVVLQVHRRHLNESRYVKGWVGWGPKVPFDGVLVTRHTDGSLDRRPPGDLYIRPGHIALLPDSRLLVAGGGADRGETGGWEPNAVVYSPEGKPEYGFCLGDDVTVLVTDRSGGIWTAYGDRACGLEFRRTGRLGTGSGTSRRTPARVHRRHRR